MNEAANIQVNALAKDLSNASGQPFNQVAQQLVLSAATQVQQFAQAYAPRRSGRLSSSIQMSTGKNNMSASVRASTPYAQFVEFGTGTRGEFPGAPIVIVPRRAQYLRFKGRDGKIVFTKKVVSPGMAPRPFLRPAVERIALPFANNLADQAVVFIVRGPNNPESLSNAPATGWH